MALHFIRRDWTTKPPAGTPLRADGHWTTDGLVLCSPFNEAGGSYITNLLGKPGTGYNMSSSASKFTSKGYQINEASTIEYISYGAGILNGLITDKITVVCQFVLDAVPSANRSYHGSGSPLSTRAYNVLSKSTGEFGYTVDSSVNTIYYGSLVPVAGRTYMNVLRYDGANVSAFVNGVRDIADQAQTGNIDNLSSVSTRIGYTGSTSVRTAAATYQFFAIYNRALSETEIELLYENPWQMFQPRLDAVIIPSAGTTSISSDIALKWDMLNIINSDSTLKYDILNTVYNSKTLKWDILNTVSGDSTLKFDIFNTVASDSILKWDMSGLVSSDLALKWDMAGVTYSDFTCRFDILNQIASDLALKFDITSTVVGDLILKFDINSTVSSDLSVVWDAVGGVYSDCTIRFGIDRDEMKGYFFIQDPINRYSKYNKHKNYKKRYKVV